MKPFFLAALAAAFIFPQAVGAITDSEAASHNALIMALNRAGVEVYADADQCNTGKVNGFYHSPSKSLVLCNGGSKTMTDDNLDTLRHESIHVVQDCKLGKLGDKRMAEVMNPLEAVQLLRRSGYDPDKIRNAYKARGASDHVIKLEFEAWAGAASLRPEQITQALNIYCASK